MITQIDSDLLRNMFYSGLKEVKNNVKKINDLNVFSVPDNDTGTNMEQTLEAAVKAVMNNSYNSVGDFMKDFARGSLLGAKGNSGVILSQYIRGFAKFVEDKKTLTVIDFSKGMVKGVERAFESVVKPIDGTILSVMKDAYTYMIRNVKSTSTFETLLRGLVEETRRSLEDTPNKLDVLKSFRVVDAGGAGFLCMIQGMEHAVKGETVNPIYLLTRDADEEEEEKFFGPDSVLETGYCLEFMLQLQNSKVNIDRFDPKTLKAYLEAIGDSVVVVKDDDIVKAHVHSFTPGKIIDHCREYGEYLKLKVENMSVQHNETLVVKEGERFRQKLQHKSVAVIAMLPGQGLRKTFTDLGCDVVLDGNGSGEIRTETLMEIFTSLPADDYIIIPNDGKNMKAAEEAAWKKDSLNIHILNAQTIPQGMAALKAMNLGKDIDTTVSLMEDAAKRVGSGLIAKATKDAEIDGVKVKAGHYVCILNDLVILDSDDKLEICIKLVDYAAKEKDVTRITILYSESVMGREMQLLKSALDSNFQNIEFEFICAGQVGYTFIFAIQ